MEERSFDVPLSSSGGARGRSSEELFRRATSLVAPELDAVRRLVRDACLGGPESSMGAALNLVEGSGKLLRPLVALLGALAVGGEARSAVAHAAAAELVHDATLLHDDVLDEGAIRRGRPASRVVWGNTVSVLTGDLLFVRALILEQETGQTVLLRELMETVQSLVEGEVLQHELRGRFVADEQLYFAIIERKTAALFRWCARAGARAGGGSEAQVRALDRFGFHLGRAFQVRDDVLDLWGDATSLGKELAQDLAEGKLTLPAIEAAKRNPELLFRLKRTARDGTEATQDGMRVLVEAIGAAGGLAAAREFVRRELTLAITTVKRFPPTSAIELLTELAQSLDLQEVSS